MSTPSELLYCVGVADSNRDFDLASEFFAAFEVDFSSWLDNETQTLRHTVYYQTEPEAAAGLEKLRSAAASPEWRESGLHFGKFDLFKLKREDWSEVWKKYFHPIEISKNLQICPSWLKPVVLPGQKVLILNPGMSFGTGQHATTLYCLQTIDRLAGKPGVKSLLDAGCGSGILSIAGSLLGYEPIAAFDLDPDAVRVAGENCAQNHVANVAPVVGDAETYQDGRTYDLVCANILGHLLRRFRHNIVTWVRPGGYLALAGILKSDFDTVAADFTELGFEELDRGTLREWTGGLFCRKN